MERDSQKHLSGTLLAETHELFQQATKSSGAPTNRDYIVGGSHIRLQFATTALIPHLTPALAHLARPTLASTPDLTICLWDSVSSRLRVAPSSWFPAGFSLAQGFSAGDGTFTVVFNAATDTLSVLDMSRRLGFYWVADPDRLSAAERGSPFVLFLQGLVCVRGQQVLHAGVVGTPEGGVLLAGGGGAGKSTSALACLAAGMKYVSDDYCLFSPLPSPQASSLFSSGKLTDDSLRLLPVFLPHVRNPEREAGEKALFLLHDVWKGQIVGHLPIHAVLLPCVTGRRDTRLQPTSATAGVKALIPSNIFQVAAVAPAAFRMIGALLRRVACYRLEVGTEVEQIPRVIRAFLSGT